jgi:hypothetical protein
VTLLGHQLPVRKAFPGPSLFGRPLIDPVYVVDETAPNGGYPTPSGEVTRTVVVPVLPAQSGVPLVPPPIAIAAGGSVAELVEAGREEAETDDHEEDHRVVQHLAVPEGVGPSGVSHSAIAL